MVGDKVCKLFSYSNRMKVQTSPCCQFWRGALIIIITFGGKLPSLLRCPHLRFPIFKTSLISCFYCYMCYDIVHLVLVARQVSCLVQWWRSHPCSEWCLAFLELPRYIAVTYLSSILLHEGTHIISHIYWHRYVHTHIHVHTHTLLANNNISFFK